MEEWKEYKLGEIVELKNGIAFKSSEFITDGIPVIKIKNVKPNKILLDDLSYVSEESSKNKKCFWIKPSDILITMTGNRKDGGADSWVGKVALFRKEGRYLLNQRVSAIRIKDTDIIDYKYLAYLLSSWDSQLYFVNHSNSSGGQANISPSVVNDYLISLPSLPTQQKIANILSSLDDEIEVNRRINEQLEEMAQALFKSWFVDFEPFKEQPFVETELGMIPEGWKVGKLGDMIKIIDNRGKTPPLATTKTNFPIIDVKALSGYGRIIDYANCMKFVSEDTYNSFFRSGHPDAYDILMSTVGSLAELKLYIEKKGTIAQNVVAFRTKNPLFLYQYLLNIKSDLITYNIGSVQPSIKVTHIIKHPILLPESAVLLKFEQLLAKITTKIYLNSKEILHLTTLRDTLLPKLMSGEIAVE